MYGNRQLNKKIICNGPEIFSDAHHDHVSVDCCSVSCILFCLIDIFVHQKPRKHPCIATHFTKSDICAFSIATKISEYFPHIIALCGIEFLEPVCGLKDIQLAIDIIQDNRITYQLKHSTVPISYIHKQFDTKTIILAKILT